MNTATANAIIVQYPSVGETFDFGTEVSLFLHRMVSARTVMITLL